MNSPSVMFRDRQYFVPPDLARSYGQHILFVNEAAWALDGCPCVSNALVESIESILMEFTRQYDPNTDGFKMSPDEILTTSQRLREALVKWISDAASLSGALHYLSSEFNGYLAAERRDVPEVQA